MKTITFAQREEADKSNPVCSDDCKKAVVLETPTEHELYERTILSDGKAQREALETYAKLLREGADVDEENIDYTFLPGEQIPEIGEPMPENMSMGVANNFIRVY